MWGDNDFSDIDLTGYTWANLDETRTLFYELGALPAGSLDDYTATFAGNSGYAEEAFSKFDTTDASGWTSYMIGFTRTVSYSSQAGFQAVTGWIDGPNPYYEYSPQFQAAIPEHFKFEQRQLTFHDFGTGAFVNKAQVPEPTAWAIFVSGAVAVGFMRLRRRRDPS